MTRHLLLFLSLLLSATGLWAQATLPFAENWESGTFVTNGWTVNNGDGFANAMANGVNGSLALNFGHAIPRLGNAPASIVSPLIQIPNSSTGQLSLSFDYLFQNPAATKWELLSVFIDKGNGWQFIFEFSHIESYSWQFYKTIINCDPGQSIRLKLMVQPLNDEAFGYFCIDNVAIESLGENTVDFNITTVVQSATQPIGISSKWSTPQIKPTNSFKIDSSFYYFDGDTISYWQQQNWGYGTIFDLSSFTNPCLYELDFQQFELEGIPMERFPYRVHIIDYSKKESLATFGPFVTNGVSFWVKNIPLNLASYPEVDSVAILIEPLMFIFLVHYYGVPFVAGDVLPNTNSCQVSLNDLTFYPTESNLRLKLKIAQQLPSKSTLSNTSQFAKETPTYNLHRWQESLPLNYTLMNATPLSDTSYFDAAVEKGWYSYFVEATYPNQQVLYSDTARAYMPTSAGLNEPTHAQASLFPNPAQHQLHISTPQSITGLQLLNSQGRQVANLLPEPTQALTVPLAAYAPGLYVARITFANGTVGSYTFVKE